MNRPAIRPPPCETACEDELAAAIESSRGSDTECGDCAPTSDTIRCQMPEMACWADEDPEHYPVARLPEPWARLAEMSRLIVDPMA